MWNVNLKMRKGDQKREECFRLTMWNVNMTWIADAIVALIGFRLTMWNVNGAKRKI